MEKIPDRRFGRHVPYISVPCNTCGKIKEYPPCEIRSKNGIKYCSMKCRNDGYKKPGSRVVVRCAKCGKEILRRADHLSRYKKAFCSHECNVAFNTNPNAKKRDKALIKEYMKNYVRLNRKALTDAERERNKRPEIRNKKLLIQKRYRDSHRELLRATARARRLGLKAGSFTEEEWLKMLEYYGYKCLCCGCDDCLLEADHVVSLVNGGQHCAANIQPLCRSCNASKGSKNTDYRPIIMA